MPQPRMAGLGKRRIDDGRRVCCSRAPQAHPCLDVDHGKTYPYVTSSNTVAGQAAFRRRGRFPAAGGLCVGHRQAHATRVGEGPFPSETPPTRPAAPGPNRGNEFGTNHRPASGGCRLVRRRAGASVRWRFSGIPGYVLTKLDVLDGFEGPLKICTGFTASVTGKPWNYLPPRLERSRRASEPDHEEMEGMEAALTRVGVRSWRELFPRPGGVNYIRRIEALIGAGGPPW